MGQEAPWGSVFVPWIICPLGHRSQNYRKSHWDKGLQHAWSMSSHDCRCGSLFRTQSISDTHDYSTLNRIQPRCMWGPMFFLLLGFCHLIYVLSFKMSIVSLLFTTTKANMLLKVHRCLQAHICSENLGDSIWENRLQRLLKSKRWKCIKGIKYIWRNRRKEAKILRGRI